MSATDFIHGCGVGFLFGIAVTVWALAYWWARRGVAEFYAFFGTPKRSSDNGDEAKP